MKDTIENYQLLLIRACKKSRSPRILRRIYAASRALPFSLTPIEYVTHGLMEIIKDYELVKDWDTFIAEIGRKQDGEYYFREPISFAEAYLESCISVISCTAVAKFPRYPRCAWFRNKYPED